MTWDLHQNMWCSNVKILVLSPSKQGGVIREVRSP